MSTMHDQPYFNETPEAERRQIVKGDARKLQEPGDRGSTYMSQSIARIGEELGGRFRHLAKEQIVTGSVPFVHVPGQPATSHWGDGTRLPDELPLGVDINAVGDVTTLDGKPCAKLETGKV